MTIRAIFYDFDGTLRMNMPDSWYAFGEFATSLGFANTQEDRTRMARWEHYYFAESQEIIADRVAFPELSDFWQNFCERQLVIMGATSEQAVSLAPRMHECMSNAYRPLDMVPTDLVETLKTLKSQGYLLGVLSNRDESYLEYLHQLGLGDFFSHVIFAAEAGVFKPNPDVFKYMLKRAGVSAGECVYVGDNYFADVLGARSAGVSPILIDVNGVFKDPDCPVIQSHSQIFPLLEQR